MTFAQRRNRLTTHFSERIPVVKRRISVIGLVHSGLFPVLYSPYKNALPCTFDDFKYILEDAVRPSVRPSRYRQNVTQTSLYCCPSGND